LADFLTVIMAAGQGTRMQSDLAKVLHKINDRPMVFYVIDLAKAVGSQRVILIIGHQKERVMEECKETDVEFAIQEEQLGTGHAVQQAEDLLKDFDGDILVLSGDVPLLSETTIRNLITTHKNSNALATLLSADLNDPTGYGRVVRDGQGNALRIVEHKDATEEELQIKEISVGIYMFKAVELFKTLRLVNNDNVQGEYYLPDVIKIYINEGEKVVVQLADNFNETRGINTVEQLKEAEQILLTR